MDNKNLGKEVSEHILEIKNLKNELYYKKNELDRHYNSKIREKEKLFSNLKERFQEIALEKAIEDNQCPSSRWGQALDPTDVSVDEEGITLTWENESQYHSSSFDYYSISWAELLELEAQKAIT